MFVPGLPPALRRAVHLAQGFSRCRVARDTRKPGQCRAYGGRPEEPGDGDGAVKKPRPKTEPVPRITLVSLDNSTTVTVLEAAQRLAKRRNFTLVKVNDLEGKTQRPVYRLMNSTSVLEEAEEDSTRSADRTAQKPGRVTKLLYISGKITEHDLQTKTKNVMRLLSKGHKVKIVVTLDGANGDKMQRVIKDAVGDDGSVQRMPSKKTVILLLISPLLKSEDISVDSKEKSGSSNSSS